MPVARPSLDDATDSLATGASPMEAFELAALLRRCMDDHSLAAGLVDTFTSRLTSMVKTIECLLAETNWSLAAAKVHELKGEAGSLGAIGLQAAAGVLEECLRTSCAREAPALFLPLKLAAHECVNARSVTLERLGR